MSRLRLRLKRLRLRLAKPGAQSRLCQGTTIHRRGPALRPGGWTLPGYHCSRATAVPGNAVQEDEEGRGATGPSRSADMGRTLAQSQ